MNLQYEEIYSVFLSMVNDYSFLKNDRGFVYEQLCGWLHSVCSMPRVSAKFLSIEFNDEDNVLNFELKKSIDEKLDVEFVKGVFAKGMVIAWLEPQVKNVLLTNQFFGGKEEKYYSQSAHLKELQTLLSDSKEELAKMLRDYGYLNNSYIKE